LVSSHVKPLATKLFEGGYYIMTVMGIYMGFSVYVMRLNVDIYFPRKTSWDPPLFLGISRWSTAQPPTKIAASNLEGLD
jgi:hypothetical protein